MLIFKDRNQMSLNHASEELVDLDIKVMSTASWPLPQNTGKLNLPEEVCTFLFARILCVLREN